MRHDEIDPVLIHRYTKGKCDVFARALWISNGRVGHLAVLVKSPTARYHHVYYEHPSGRLVDVLGACDPRTAQRRWGWHVLYRKIDPDIQWMIRQDWRGDRCGGHVTQALRVINKDPNRYILGRTC